MYMSFFCFHELNNWSSIFSIFSGHFYCSQYFSYCRGVSLGAFICRLHFDDSKRFDLGVQSRSWISIPKIRDFFLHNFLGSRNYTEHSWNILVYLGQKWSTHKMRFEPGNHFSNNFLQIIATWLANYII